MWIPGRRRVLLFVLVSGVLAVPTAVSAATRTWSGLGADTNWMTPGNWDVLPVAGDDLVFPSGVPLGSLTNNNNFAALTGFNSIMVNGNGYTLNGNAIALGTAGIGGTGSATINLAISIAATATLSTSSTIDFFGLVSGAGGLTNSGTGLFRLRAANTYIGPTTINAGSLSIEGFAPSSPITVNAGGTLTGSNVGSMGSVTVSGGTVDPGVSAGGVAVITVTDLAMNAASTFVVDMVALGSFDRVAVNGPVNLGGSTLTVNPLFVPAVGDTFNIVSNGGLGAIVGTFAGLPQGAVFSAGGIFFSISYVAEDGNDVDLTVVTGPGTPTVTTTPTGTLSPTVTTTPTATGTITVTPTPTFTLTPAGVSTPTPTLTSTPTATATSTPTGQPTSTSTPTPTATSPAAPTSTTTPGPAATALVPTLSFPMLAFFALALGLAALLLIRRP